MYIVCVCVCVWMEYVSADQCVCAKGSAAFTLELSRRIFCDSCKILSITHHHGPLRYIALKVSNRISILISMSMGIQMERKDRNLEPKHEFCYYYQAHTLYNFNYSFANAFVIVLSDNI